MKKLKLFSQGEVTEIHDSDGKAIVSWMGFDDSDIPLTEHRKHARDLVRAYNAYPDMLKALETIANSPFPLGTTAKDGFKIWRKLAHIASAAIEKTK